MRVHVPHSWVPGALVLLLVVQPLGEYRIISCVEKKWRNRMEHEIETGRFFFVVYGDDFLKVRETWEAINECIL